MKIAEDDDGKVIKAPCKEYYRYLLTQKDDSPLYMFQSSFDKINGTGDMIERYTVPRYFREDFYEDVSRVLTADGRKKKAALQMVPDRA